jgi:hypothetical protein
MSGNGTNPLFPAPLHHFLLWQLISFGYLLVVPMIYALGLITLWNSKIFGPFVITCISVVAALSIIWFVVGWELSLTYQGARYAWTMLVANFVGLFISLALSIEGWRRKSKSLQVSAYFSLFILLAWCAFPWLGGPP